MVAVAVIAAVVGEAAVEAGGEAHKEQWRVMRQEIGVADSSGVFRCRTIRCICISIF